MAKDLSIRLVGRPKITKDSNLGFNRLNRKYVVLAPRASKEGIEDSRNPLFLEVGTPDEEFEKYYLVNQSLEPSTSVDKAGLVRDYVDIRDTFSTEGISESGDLKKMQRKYTVLRANHEKGYDDASWANHPHNCKNSGNDPWDYLPEVIKNTEPTQVSYNDNGDVAHRIFHNASKTPAGFKPPIVEVGNNDFQPLDQAMQFASVKSNLSVRWVRATATVDCSNPGVDVWSVSWVAPVTDYWSAKEGKQSTGKSSASPSFFDFDENGVKVLRLGKAGTGGTNQVVYKSYVSFVVGEDPGMELDSWFGSGSSSLGPAVSMDFHFVGIDGNHRIASFRQALPNTWKKIDTKDGLFFPSSGTGVKEGRSKPGGEGTYSIEDEIADGEDIKVAEGTAKSYIFNYVHKKDEPYPMYQGQPIMKTGGRMDWTHYYDSSSSNSVIGSSSIAPIFSHGNTRIWKITIVFIS